MAIAWSIDQATWIHVAGTFDPILCKGFAAVNGTMQTWLQSGTMIVISAVLVPMANIGVLGVLCGVADASYIVADGSSSVADASCNAARDLT